MRALLAIALSSAFFASTALAAEKGPLSPGKPAGVKQAQLNTTSWVLLGIGAVAAIGIGVAASSNGSPLQDTPHQAVTTTTV